MGGLTFTQTVLVAFGLSLIALGIMARIAYLLQSDDEDGVGLDIFSEPADRSDGLDSTADDLLRWDVTQEGHALRNERLWAMPLEALQAEAEAKGIRGFATMDKPQLVEALGGDALAATANETTALLPVLSERSLAILDAARARTRIARSPIRRDWRESPPPLERPSRPGPTTVEFGRITGHDPQAGVGPDEQLTLDLGVTP